MAESSIRIKNSGTSSAPIVVANYAALPAPNTAPGQFYWCSASQGTYWLPGPLGGTYYPSGLYYSNGVGWEYMSTPYNATQADVDAGTITDQFVSPKTFNDSAQLAAKVPYTGATGDVNLGEYELKAGQIELDQSPTGTAGVAVTRWNDSLGSSETTLKGGSVILKNGVDLVARVVNKVTPNATLTKATYRAVRVSGAQGQRLAVAYAQANNDNNSADTIGLVCETIPTNQEGFILTVGQLEGINTTGSLQSETWTDGDVLYLSPTTPGAITNIKPSGATGHIVVIGYVEYAHAINGKIYVKIMNGWELDELHNVYIDSGTLANNQVLTYESSTSLWKNKALTTASIADSTNKRYVTDAQLTVLGNTSNTNTGDETQSTIFSKLKLAIKKGINYSAVTGTTAETLVGTLTFTANSFESSDNLRILVNATRSGTTSGVATVRVKVNSVNDFSTATTIATIATANSAQNYFGLVRENMFISGGNLQGFAFTTSSLTDVGLLANTPGSVAVDVAQPLYFFVSIQNASGTESNQIRVFKISNI